MENFNTLSAQVVGSDVHLSWNLNQVVAPVSVVIQRSPFGTDDSSWTDIHTALLTDTSYTDPAPAAGNYAYRLKVASTQGSIDSLNTLLFSNVRDVSNLAATGVLTLTSTQKAADNRTGTEITLAWNNPSIGDVLSYQVEQSLNGGTTFRVVHNEPDEESVGWAQDLPTGLGSVQYRVRAFLPPEQDGNSANWPQTVSNTITVTV